jgi:ABC-type cobalamin/Fe3+-siderophores transport system ATPase subunit
MVIIDPPLGKTTLLRTMSGWKANGGEVVVDGVFILITSIT